MPNMKKAALAYARAGFPVFPVHYMQGDHCSCGNKSCNRTAKHPINTGGHKKATTNKEQIEKWWDEHPDANIATCPGDTNHMVIDVDPKGDDSPYPETEKLARTPRGGYHLWYRVPKGEHIPNSASKLGEDIDVRGHDGYVILPPSATAAGSYSWDSDRPAADAPSWLTKEAQEGGLRERKPDADVWKIEPDAPEHIALARQAARGVGPNALTPAIEGEGGDHKTFAAGAMMRSFGLSAQMATDVLWEEYNLRCDPPWEYEDLQRKVRNAYTYATSAPGNMTEAYQLLKRRELVELFQREDGGREAKLGGFRVIDRTGMDSIKPPKWLIHDMIPEEAYVMLYGPPESYKTFLALDMALSVAAGFTDWLDGRSINSQGPVLYVAGEGRSGLLRRVRAWEHHWNKGKAVRDFTLADPVPGVDGGLDDFITAAAELHKTYKLIVLDTVGKALAGANENEQKVASAFTKQVLTLSRTFEATVIAIHHTGWQDPRNPTNRPRERGSSVFRADADVMFGLNEGELYMTKIKDGEHWKKPLPLVPVKVPEANSIVLELGDHRDEKALTDNQRDWDVAATAIVKEHMPAGGEGMSDRELAVLISAIEKAGTSEETWRERLKKLRVLPSALSAYYDVHKKKWFRAS